MTALRPAPDPQVATVAGFAESSSVYRVLRFPFTNWNWKSAFLSILLRSTVYLCATLRHGLYSGLAAVLVEVVYVGLSSGFYSGLQQSSLRVRPRYLADLLIVVAVPVLAQTVDWKVHRLAHTPNLKTASVSVMCLALVSALFHLYVMRRGAMLVGEGTQTFANDLKQMPLLILSFLIRLGRVGLDVTQSLRRAAAVMTAQQISTLP